MLKGSDAVSANFYFLVWHAFFLKVLASFCVIFVILLVLAQFNAHILCAHVSDSKLCQCYFVSFCISLLWDWAQWVQADMRKIHSENWLCAPLIWDLLHKHEVFCFQLPSLMLTIKPTKPAFKEAIKTESVDSFGAHFFVWEKQFK